jgi:biopolymer transport protein ExbD
LRALKLACVVAVVTLITATVHASDHISLYIQRDGSFDLNNHHIHTRAELKSELAKLLTKTSERSVIVQADKRVSYATVSSVMRLLQPMGVHIGIVGVESSP